MKIRMRIAVISDPVARLRDLLRDCWIPLDILSAHEKRGFHAMFLQQVEKRRCRFARAVVERQRERTPPPVSVIDARSEKIGCPSAHGVRKSPARGAQDSQRSADQR